MLTPLTGCSDGSSLGVGGSGEDLSGRILTTASASTRNTGVIYEIDPSTGQVDEFIRPKPDGDGTANGPYRPGDPYHPLASFAAAGALDQDVLLLSVANCQAPTASARATCIERVGADGDVQRLFTTDDYPVVPAVMSPDGTLIASLVSPGLVEGLVTLALKSSRDRTRSSPNGAID